MIVLTGDTHGDFDRIVEFCEYYDTTTEDIMIILGDAGINYYLDARDRRLKEELAQLPITLFCVHGNHEERPSEISGYEEMEWRGGIVLYEPVYPNILFAQDGEIYEFAGKKAIVIGGAYSIDKYYRLSGGGPWFESEQPDEWIKAYVEAQLKKVKWEIDYVFSHTVPLSYEPREAFLPNIDEGTVDKSTEKWLETIANRLSYENWYAGHYHVDWSMDRVRILYEDFLELEGEFDY
ncbi:MAG: metallophosphoesterase [Peptococcia bacterium]